MDFQIFFILSAKYFIMERLSTVQYEKKTGMSKQLILYYIKNGKPLPGVDKVEVIAGRNILHTNIRKMQQHFKNKVA